jgi:hypothetical protein
MKDKIVLWWNIRRIEKNSTREFKKWFEDRNKAGKVGELIDTREFRKLPFMKAVEKINHLRSKHLVFEALSYQLPIPSPDKMVRETEYWYLEDKDYVALRNAIRAEKKARWDAWFPYMITAGTLIVAMLALWLKS